jgi:AbrB family looped-hinge helix DNA binding protein
MKATVGERGQVTIPKALRERFGIRPREDVEFIEDVGRLVRRKADVAERIHSVCGILDLDMSTDEFIDLVRGPAELPPEDESDDGP